MAMLWETSGKTLHEEVEAFETGSDLLTDQKLIPYDIEGSIAHAKMLKKIGILNNEELENLLKGLEEIEGLDKKGEFNLEFGDEDIHSKIENYLTEKYGEPGKKIHTGRSRNDQVVTAIRLLSKDFLGKISKAVEELIQNFDSFAKEYKGVPMPGYTHMQKAMPSSVSLWAQSFKEALEDDLLVLKTAQKLNDQSPLGTGAGYGVPLELDRELTKELLGFDRIQNNPIYVQNSRGKIEGVVLSSLVNVLQTINKFASDVMVFSTSEFNFFKVSNELTTGSSIMPQKKNIDIAELLRSKVHVVLGNYVQIITLMSNLTSGYNRDGQDTKKPLIESVEITLQSLIVSTILLEYLKPNEEALKEAMTPELYQTEKAFELVKQGIPFREAYIKIKKQNK